MARVACCRFRQADMREFWISIGHPRQRCIINLGRQAKQRIANDNARMIAGDMRELRAARDIANGKDAPIAAAQALINGDAARREFNAGGFQPKPGGIGLAAGRDQQMRSFHNHRTSTAAQFQFNTCASVARRHNLNTLMQGNAFADQGVAQDRHSLGLIAGQDGGVFNQRDAGAEAAKGLRHFNPDRASAQDQHMVRPFLQIEDRFIG